MRRTFKNILVVDDRGINRLLPGLILRPFGLQVFECSDGYEVLSMIREKEISGVLLDISMPGVSGIDVLKMIRSDPLCRKVKVFAYTAYATSEDEAELIDLGFDAVLIKPITSSRLVQLFSD